MKEFSLSWGMLAAAAVLNVAGLYAIKATLATLGAVPVTSFAAALEYVVRFARSPLAVTGVVCIFAAPLPHAVALSRMQLAIAYPASVALTCVMLLPVSFVTLGEPLTAPRMVGVALLLVSLVFLYR